MANQTAEFRNDLGPLLDEAYDLVAATKDISGDNIQNTRKRLAATLAARKELYKEARHKTVAGAKSADEYVRQNPYRVIGFCLGIGLLAGFLLSRRE